MKSSIHARSVAALLVTICLLIAPVTAFAKGDKNYKRGLDYEAAQQWEKAAQEFALAVAASPSRMEYQLHYRRALFNASQMFMIKGRALAEQLDYTGAYNAFRQASVPESSVRGSSVVATPPILRRTSRPETCGRRI